MVIYWPTRKTISKNKWKSTSACLGSSAQKKAVSEPAPASKQQSSKSHPVLTWMVRATLKLSRVGSGYYLDGRSQNNSRVAMQWLAKASHSLISVLEILWGHPKFTVTWQYFDHKQVSSEADFTRLLKQMHCRLLNYNIKDVYIAFQGLHCYSTL